MRPVRRQKRQPWRQRSTTAQRTGQQPGSVAADAGATEDVDVVADCDDAVVGQAAAGEQVRGNDPRAAAAEQAAIRRVARHSRLALREHDGRVLRPRRARASARLGDATCSRRLRACRVATGRPMARRAPRRARRARQGRTRISNKMSLRRLRTETPSQMTTARSTMVSAQWQPWKHRPSARVPRRGRAPSLDSGSSSGFTAEMLTHEAIGAVRVLGRRCRRGGPQVAVPSSQKNGTPQGIGVLTRAGVSGAQEDGGREVSSVSYDSYGTSAAAPLRSGAAAAALRSWRHLWCCARLRARRARLPRPAGNSLPCRPACRRPPPEASGRCRRGWGIR